VGDVLVGITYHGLTSNRVRIGIGHMGGGPPDDGSTTPAPTPELGSGASLHGKQLFPPDNPGTRTYRTCRSIQIRQSDLPALEPPLISIRLRHSVYNGAPNGIPYVVVSNLDARVPINFTAYGDESDPGPYPVPVNATDGRWA
jgi:hypothetical protein